jgi:hypothetical protein
MASFSSPVRGTGMRHQGEASVLAATQGLDAQQLVEDGARRNVTARATDQLAERVGLAIEGQRARPAVRIPEVRLSQPRPDHPRRPVVTKNFPNQTTDVTRAAQPGGGGASQRG